jgi:hypothetical protein
MMHFESFAQSPQYGNGVFHRRGVDYHRLESSLQGCIFLYMFTIFIQSGCADAVQFSAGKHGLKHIACIHSAFRISSADDSVQLIYEEQYFPFAFFDLIQNSFKTLFKFPSIFGSSDQ